MINVLVVLVLVFVGFWCLSYLFGRLITWLWDRAEARAVAAQRAARPDVPSVWTGDAWAEGVAPGRSHAAAFPLPPRDPTIGCDQAGAERTARLQVLQRDFHDSLVTRRRRNGHGAA